MFGKGSEKHCDVQLGQGKINIWVSPTLKEWDFKTGSTINPDKYCKQSPKEAIKEPSFLEHIHYKVHLLYDTF